MEYIIEISLFILKGSLLTLKLYGVTIVCAIPLGIVLALLKISRFKIAHYFIAIYTWIFRGTPLILQLFFVYYGLSLVGISLQPFTAAALTFIVNYGAYFTEIYRGGILSIDAGQYEAAKALSMSYPQTIRRIILPQVVRRTIPATCNEAITLIKDTALVIVIGMGDLMRSANEIFTRDFTISPFIIAAIIYLAMTWVIVTIFNILERKYSFYE